MYEGMHPVLFPPSRVGDVLGAVLGDPEHVSQSPGVHTRVDIGTFHGESLTRTRLPVGKDTDIVTGWRAGSSSSSSSNRRRDMLSVGMKKKVP